MPGFSIDVDGLRVTVCRGGARNSEKYSPKPPWLNPGSGSGPCNLDHARHPLGALPHAATQAEGRLAEVAPSALDRARPRTAALRRASPSIRTFCLSFGLGHGRTELALLILKTVGFAEIR